MSYDYSAPINSKKHKALLRKYQLVFTALHEISAHLDKGESHEALCLARGAMQAAINLGDGSDE